MLAGLVRARLNIFNVMLLVSYASVCFMLSGKISI